MKKYFYEYGQLNWLYVIFGLYVTGFLVSFFASMITEGDSTLFFAIHNNDNLSLVKIWKLIFYPFADSGVFSLVSNLIWLSLFGMVLASYIGSQQVFTLHVVASTIVGLLAGLICLFPQSKFYILLLGPTPALIAIAAACVYKAPQYKIPLMIIGEIPIWIIGLIFMLVKIFTIPSANFLMMLVLFLLAIPVGIFFMKYKFGNIENITNWFSSLTRKKPKRGKVIPFNKTSRQNTNPDQQEHLNQILDKISAKGVDSLSKSEKAFLESWSKK